MERDAFFYGRNVLEEALKAGSTVREVWAENRSAQDWATGVLRLARKNIQVRNGIPSALRDQAHQGIVFKADHQFYIDGEDLFAGNQPLLLCNHLNDVQNLGALTRSAVSFGIGALIHENRRSVKLTPAAVKASAGLAFRMSYFEVPNIMSIVQQAKKRDYIIIGLDVGPETSSLYDFKICSGQPWALIVGSEGEGMSRPIVKQCDHLLHIPMAAGVDSLNVGAAAAIAMSWFQANS